MILSKCVTFVYHFHFFHLADKLDQNPVKDLSDSGKMCVFSCDDLAVGPEDAFLQPRRSKREAGDQQLVPASPDQRDLEKVQFCINVV